MSWARTNLDERPRFLMGEAIMRHLDDARDRETHAAELEAIRTVLLLQLSDEEVMELFTSTGWDIAGMLDWPTDTDQPPLPFSPPGGSSDEDVPF